MQSYALNILQQMARFGQDIQLIFTLSNETPANAMALNAITTH